MAETPEAMVASSFQAGNTCPACQRLIEENQRIIRCDQCGGLHHELCWQVQAGCSSYHCDKRARADFGRLQADLVISASDAERVVVPPMPPRARTEELARMYLPEEPKRLSRLAVAASVLAVLSAMTVWGVAAETWPLAVCGFALALIALVTGIIGLVVIYTGGRAKGLKLAGTALGFTAAVMLVSVGILALRERGSRGDSAAVLDFSNSAPSEETLSRLDPIKANALRANVVVRAQGGGWLSSATLFGSGTILRVVGQRAFILTNRHAIEHEGAILKRIEVLFHNGERSGAVVEWLAPGGMDIAILSCQALTLTGIEPAKLASDLAAQSERVFVIGNPLNLSWSYSEGVICATRSQNTGDRAISVYQTQAPTRPGSSGGGLYDMSGTLLGVNTWTENTTTGEGMSFAISTKSILEALPAEAAARFLQQGAEAPQGAQ
ncbi:MAG: trypsin-like peptidase domain-containing protein [Candidatus Brocadiia bacterium]|jgi:S1-C subfamily serine protease